nr:immunoglobulin light chain junction region [Macaca mulatta]MOW09000.1 immunoglobulin light chain junction region [Macaca mulatta]MOX52643.1 immunoglobulin light chain junction region [Macaca mulatta]MOX52827.1 immunoglobulin light chain junction region [Macaca mulatta]MOX53137.1 immunoglobulin light chain junction region [Macaca mulatta]
CLQHHSYPYSF